MRLEATVEAYHTAFGDALAHLGWWGRAVAEYHDAARISPDEPVLLVRLGRALAETGQPLVAVFRTLM